MSRASLLLESLSYRDISGRYDKIWLVIPYGLAGSFWMSEILSRATSQERPQAIEQDFHYAIEVLREEDLDDYVENLVLIVIEPQRILRNQRRQMRLLFSNLSQAEQCLEKVKNAFLEHDIYNNYPDIPFEVLLQEADRDGDVYVPQRMKGVVVQNSRQGPVVDETDWAAHPPSIGVVTHDESAIHMYPFKIVHRG